MAGTVIRPTEPARKYHAVGDPYNDTGRPKSEEKQRFALAAASRAQWQ
jgi:hypothetical protein